MTEWVALGGIVVLTVGVGYGLYDLWDRSRLIILRLEFEAHADLQALRIAWRESADILSALVLRLETLATPPQPYLPEPATTVTVPEPVVVAMPEPPPVVVPHPRIAAVVPPSKPQVRLRFTDKDEARIVAEYAIEARRRSPEIAIGAHRYLASRFDTTDDCWIYRELA